MDSPQDHLHAGRLNRQSWGTPGSGSKLNRSYVDKALSPSHLPESEILPASSAAGTPGGAGSIARSRQVPLINPVGTPETLLTSKASNCIAAEKPPRTERKAPRRGSSGVAIGGVSRFAAQPSGRFRSSVMAFLGRLIAVALLCFAVFKVITLEPEPFCSTSPSDPAVPSDESSRCVPCPSHSICANGVVTSCHDGYRMAGQGDDKACVPCAEFEKCREGHLIECCSKKYSMTDSGCALDTPLGKFVHEMESYVQDAVQRRRGRAECAYFLFSNGSISQADLFANLRSHFGDRGGFDPAVAVLAEDLREGRISSVSVTEKGLVSAVVSKKSMMCVLFHVAVGLSRVYWYVPAVALVVIASGAYWRKTVQRKQMVSAGVAMLQEAVQRHGEEGVLQDDLKEFLEKRLLFPAGITRRQPKAAGEIFSAVFQAFRERSSQVRVSADQHHPEKSRFRWID